VRIVIVGGGTAGWMAATLFARAWPRERVQITLIESPEIGIIGVGEGSTPLLRKFFADLGVEEAEWMPRCNATHKLNIRFVGWSTKPGCDSYSHPFPTQIDAHTTRAFFVNCLTRRLGLDVETRPDAFNLNAVLAANRKGPRTTENFPFEVQYGYHFDSGLLGVFLRERACGMGVQHAQGRIARVEQRESGVLQALHTDSGEVLEADFFVDCTGFASLLSQQALGVRFESFGSNLFNDSAVVMPTPHSQPFLPETRSTALSAGWCWHIPLTSRIGNGYVYSSRYIDADAAEAELRRHLGLVESDVPARHLKMRVGQVERHWSHNCLALGLAGGFIEPLEATALHLVQVGIEAFIHKFDPAGSTAAVRDEYNRFMANRFERVRDYIVAHYRLNSRTDTDYWRDNARNDQLSNPLRSVLNAWHGRADLAAELDRLQLDSHFGALSWHCLLAGYGAFPALAPNQPRRGTGDRYLELQLERFLQRCAMNFLSVEDCLPWAEIGTAP
jgi:2-polyprenyl-6-methoxyphenol hydroxylase-like FAD-dependent oxidoreductase